MTVCPSEGPFLFDVEQELFQLLCGEPAMQGALMGYGDSTGLFAHDDGHGIGLL